MKVNKWLIPTLALALLLGTVGVAQATGWWLVSGREMVNLEQLTGGADVKGWMTLEQVAGGIGMETATLNAKLGLPADIPPATALKDLEGVTAGFEVTTVRAVVDEVLGLAPAAGTEEAPARRPTDRRRHRRCRRGPPWRPPHRRPRTGAHADHPACPNRDGCPYACRRRRRYRRARR